MNTSSNVSDAELRRTHGIHESVLMRFVGRDKNTTFSVDVVKPLHQRAAPTISGRHQKWMITMNNGLSCVADAWIHYLGDCHLKAGDEVIFFYNIDQHLWEVLYRKQVTWDDTEDEADSP
ncbi:hypothetical protein JHK82_028134 [Glycine max]|uniref:DUF7271 domain-containing protein n=1 Tax=Glycine soja TaxID=3848 RepID=A0A0B2Q1V2_GLYSO|nr:hypothetical protein JHK85_028799 [Glycine max]KAG5004119.1 hypothetical protein JHK86_028258 [Glycine max]KAG5127299.1 hypothetical protein JHK82_028134 [Glycine max]KHN13963.1 hypothetical protein glysoja_043158 [Glycine soja]